MDGVRGLILARPPSFLTTIPSIPPSAVHRPRLTTLLGEAVEHDRVVLLQAPSGFGKTTLVADWAGRQDRPVAWLSLTEFDASPERLLNGIVTTLARANRVCAPGLAAELEHVQLGNEPLATTLQSTVDAVARAGERLVVVLDDAHLMGADAVPRVIHPLVLHGQGLIRLVLASAEQIRPWFWRISADHVETIDAPTLAFTAEEVAEVVRRGGSTTAEETASARATELMAATDGWPVAVGLLLRAAGDAEPEPGHVGDSLVTDYVESLLTSLAPDLRDFVLLATATPRLDTEVATALTGRVDAAEVLEDAVRSGLFLDRITTASGATTYQWHSLFARHVRVIAVREAPDRAAQAEIDAAGVLRRRFPGEAAEHALRGGDPQLSLDILRESWLSMLVDGMPDVLQRRCLQLPEVLADLPDVLLMRACCLDLFGDRVSATALRARARTSCTGDPEMTGRASVLSDLLLADDGVVLADAVAGTRELLERPTLPPMLRLYATFLLGWVQVRRRIEIAEAVSQLSVAAATADSLGLRTLAARARRNLRFALVFAGRLSDADALADETARAGGPWDGYEWGIDLVSTTFTAYWRGDVRAVLAASAPLGSLPVPMGYSGVGALMEALAAAVEGTPAAIGTARAHLDAIPDAPSHGVPWPVYREASLAALALASGATADAVAHARVVLATPHVPVSVGEAVEVLRRAGEVREAAAVAERVAAEPVPVYVAASLARTRAAACWTLGDETEAHRLIERALTLAEPESIARPFTGADDDLRALLESHAAWGTDHEAFLAACLGRAEGGSGPTELTPREREILEYLRTTMTAEEIARALYLSVATVRTHLRGIYRKLGVSGRREAVRRA